MGPALETFLQMLGILVIALGAIAFLTRPVWMRCYCYLKAWYERDQKAEAEEKWESECRRKAEQELRQFCHEDDPAQTREDRLQRKRGGLQHTFPDEEEPARTEQEALQQVRTVGKEHQDAS